MSNLFEHCRARVSSASANDTKSRAEANDIRFAAKMELCAFRRLRPARFSALSFEERAKEDREAKMIGKPPRTSLNDHERLRLSHDRSGRSVCDGFFFRHFHIAGSSRPPACREIRYDLYEAAVNPRIGIRFFASQRLARAHCEKRGGSGGDGASARSGCAK